jgi:diguanylate cyclase (GGDEF)-like protein/PAS domain S-box-containing protein
VEYVNPKFTAITGFSNDESLGKWPDLINSGVNPPGIYEEIWQRIRDGEEWRGELQNRKKNGDLYWAQELIAPMTSETGEVSHFVATQVDITEARRLSEETSYQATHDQLTGLINRREFDLRLDRVILAAKHNLTEHALCFLDLDQFKVINDTCGHIAGDELLRQLGKLLAGSTRKTDTLARLGGDEFAILIVDCEPQQAEWVANEVREMVEQFQFIWESQLFTIGVSIGVTSIDQHTLGRTEVLKQADSACYAAKNSGRNRVYLYQQQDKQLAQQEGEFKWVNEVKEAIIDNRLELFVQPIISTRSEHLSSYEVLVRLRSKTGQLFPPGAFLPSAERYNLSDKVDRWVIDHVFAWLEQHQHKLPFLKQLAINLSGASLGHTEMLAYISAPEQKRAQTKPKREEKKEERSVNGGETEKEPRDEKK